jgi:hypothetical protein
MITHFTNKAWLVTWEIIHMSDIVERLRSADVLIVKSATDLRSAVAEEAADEIEKLRAALREIERSHIPDQPAAFDCADLDWARRHVGKLRSVARAALGEKK